MTEPLGGQHLLQVISVSTSQLARDRVAVRVNGRWTGRHRIPLGRALLVIEAEGRRHRFPVIPEARGPRLEPQNRWSAAFAMPAWLESYLMRGAWLQLGSALLDLPLPSDPDSSATNASRIRELERSLATARQEPARLNALLAKAQADLNTRTVQYERLQATHAEVRDELDRQRSASDSEGARRAELELTVGSLMDTVAALRVELAEAVVARDAALEEVDTLRHELNQLGAAVNAAREEVGPDAIALSEAESLLAEARSVSARITRRFRSSVSAADDA